MKKFLTAILALLFRFVCCPGQTIGEPDSLHMVENGHSTFSVYLPAGSSDSTRANVDTLCRYIHEVSGAEIPVTDDPNHKGNRIVVEIGDSRDSRLKISDLGNDGFVIRTDEGNLYLTANTDYGFQNAVYTFIESYLGCRMFSPTVQIVPKRNTIVLPEIYDRQVPVMTFRMQDIKERDYRAWHKLNTHEDFGLFVHTFHTLVPPEKYFDNHPEYYSLLNGNRTPNGQLCLSNQDVFKIVTEELRNLMKARPEADFWSVSQNDTYVPCECDACRAIDSVEGSPSGSIISFVNKVADEFPDMTISTLAYQYSRSAPKNIKPRPNVNIMLCSIECNRSIPLADDPSSASFVKDVEEWGRLTNNILIWDYVIQFRNLVSPFPNFHILQPNIQFFVNNGVTSVFEQGLPVFYGEFAELRIYLISKLLWNPDVDVDSVMNDFLHGFYGNAAPHIREYIDTMHAKLQEAGEGLNIYGYPTRSENGYLSAEMLDIYSELFDRAEDAVKDDPEVNSRVRTARLPVQYAILEQAKVSGTGERGCFTKNDDSTLSIRPEIESLLDSFVNQCREANIPRLWEHGISPDEYYASTRSFLVGSTTDHLARNKSVTLATPASHKYHDGDKNALTDGLTGWDDYHWHWLGFEGEEMEATIDLDSLKTVSSISTSFLQDINSWVFLPISVEFSVSDDGTNYRTVGEIENAIPAEKEGAIIAPFNVTFTPTEARYVRVKTVSMKTCPTWHKGSGGPAWIFIDEIIVQ